MRRLSTALVMTRKEPPAGARSASHALLVRAGMLRELEAGVVCGPALVRIAGRVTAIVREELTATGAQEVHTATGGPADAAIAGLARGELASHRQLPLLLSAVALAERANAPLAGLERQTVHLTRAFDLAGRPTDPHERLADGAARVFARCGLEVVRAAAEHGPPEGRTEALLAPAATGRVTVAVSDAGGYRATSDVARAALVAPEQPPARPLTRVSTPDATTMDALASYVADVPPERMVKTLLYAATTTAGAAIVAALCRGDRSIDEAKLARALDAVDLTLADPTTIRRLTCAEPGYAGPIGLPSEVRVVADEAVAGVQGFVCGANADDEHLRDVWWGRDVDLPELADLDRVADGDRAPDGGTLALVSAIPVGALRPLRAAHAGSGELTVTGATGAEEPVSVAGLDLDLEALVAALAEQRHDEAGFTWPPAVAPRTAVVVTVRSGDPAQEGLAEEVLDELLAAGVDAVWDDRDVRAGAKFADAELVGYPWRLTVGREAADGRVELTPRADGVSEPMAADEAVRRVAGAVAAARVPGLP